MRQILVELLKIIAVIGFATSSCFGQSWQDVPRLTSLKNPVVRRLAVQATPQHILASVRVGAGGGCSGTIIVKCDEKAWGISAAHCARLNQQFTFGNPDGTTGQARWIAVSRKDDLALFSCWAKDVIGVAPVQVGSPSLSSSVTACGYPDGQGPKYKQVQFSGVTHMSDREGWSGNRSSLMLQSGPFGGGDSGGGVFQEGRLFGTISHGCGHKGHPFYASSNKQLVGFVRSHTSKLCEH